MLPLSMPASMRKYFGYEGEEHSFIGDPWFVFMARTQLFFDKYVKP
jgi:hypothetical protein